VKRDQKTGFLPVPAVTHFPFIAVFFLTCAILLPAPRSPRPEYRGNHTGHGHRPKVTLVSECQYHTGNDPRSNLQRQNGQPRRLLIRLFSRELTESRLSPGFQTVIHEGVTIDVSRGEGNADILPRPIVAVNETVAATKLLQLSTADASGGTVMDPEKGGRPSAMVASLHVLVCAHTGVRFTQTQFGCRRILGHTPDCILSNAYSSPPACSTTISAETGAPISVQCGGPAGT